jgi:hypothetical protein
LTVTDPKGFEVSATPYVSCADLPSISVNFKVLPKPLVDVNPTEPVFSKGVVSSSPTASLSAIKTCVVSFRPVYLTDERPIPHNYEHCVDSKIKEVGD